MKPIKYINSIPILNTISVSLSETTAIYKLCPCIFKKLSCEGLMLLHIAQDLPATATTISLEISSNISLVDSSGSAVSTVVNGSRLLIYYNKCQNIFQVI